MVRTKRPKITSARKFPSSFHGNWAEGDNYFNVHLHRYLLRFVIIPTMTYEYDFRRGFRSLQGSVRQRERKKFIMYSIYAWGSASVLTIICAIMDFVPTVPKELIRPEFGVDRCWFSSECTIDSS